MLKLSDLTDYCKPCPECETGSKPKMSTEMYSKTEFSGVVTDPKIKIAELTCPCCGYVVRDESIRKAIARWNKLSEKNEADNHIHEATICKHCDNDFEYEILDILDPEELHMKYLIHLTCCGKQFGPYYDEKTVNERVKNHFRSIYIQKDIGEEV